MKTTKREMVKRELLKGRTLSFMNRNYVYRNHRFYCCIGNKCTQYAHIDYILPYIYKHWEELTIYR